MTAKITPPSVSVAYAHTGRFTEVDELGMRPMQERAYSRRGEQYLLIKSPPASGKSRALMFIALDKLHKQDLKQAIIAVPERTIGASFADTALSQKGFWADWAVAPKWNLCNMPGRNGATVAPSKVKAVNAFLESPDRVLVCTHATFRFAVEALGLEAFDNRLVAIDEFHHVSADTDTNVLGRQIGDLIARDKAHIVAMTGSYFRGDAVPVLLPEDEARFSTVTYTYYEQLNGYRHLKALDIGYYFYTQRYIDAILDVLDPAQKTIIHIPSVRSREALGDKLKEVEEIMGALGQWQGEDPETGFQCVRPPQGRELRIANLVDDDPAKRDRVVSALKDPAQKGDRGHVDIIIALGMAKEGFDWVWCEHALTIGYRGSLTEVVQIIGRTTRDAPGKERARFTNLIAEPDASEDVVVEAVNDTLKAVAASLLMEQVLAPRFHFTPRRREPLEDHDYGEGGYNPERTNVGFSEASGQLHIEMDGLIDPESAEARRICEEDLNEVIATFVQDSQALERGLFDDNAIPEDVTIVRMGKIVREKYPDLGETDIEAIRQRAVAALNLTQKAAAAPREEGEGTARTNTAFIDGVRSFVMDVRDLNVDLIDRISPFEAAYAVLAKALDAATLKRIEEEITAKRTQLSPDEAFEIAMQAKTFVEERKRRPERNSPDPWERYLADGVAAFARYKREGRYDQAVG